MDIRTQMSEFRAITVAAIQFAAPKYKQAGEQKD